MQTMHDIFSAAHVTLITRRINELFIMIIYRQLERLFAHSHT